MQEISMNKIKHILLVEDSANDRELIIEVFISNNIANKIDAVNNGEEAVSKLRATGAAAGFEHMVKPEDADEIYQRLAEIIELKLMKDNVITINHRYLAGIGKK